MARILGVDPGSRNTGYGVVEISGKQIRPLTHGTLRVSKNSETDHSERLLSLYRGLDTLIRNFKPDVLVVEKVFFAKNALSSLKLGQIRGVVLLCGAQHGLEIKEYSPTEVKQLLTGHGRASKEDVAKVLKLLLGVRHFETDDASDGLALALCHAHSEGIHRKLKTRPKSGRSVFQKKKTTRLSESLKHRVVDDISKA